MTDNRKSDAYSETSRRAVNDRPVWVPLSVSVEPTTSFQYRFESATGCPRRMRLERGALEHGPAEIEGFRASAYPVEDPVRGGFFISPDVVQMKAQALIEVQKIVSGDHFICQALGNANGDELTVKIHQDLPSGEIMLILEEIITDFGEHTYSVRLGT